MVSVDREATDIAEKGALPDSVGGVPKYFVSLSKNKTFLKRNENEWGNSSTQMDLFQFLFFCDLFVQFENSRTQLTEGFFPLYKKEVFIFF